MSAVHGSQGGLRATIGNLSAPWLLVAFCAGAILGRRGLWRGAVAGLFATVVALSAFYLTNIAVLGLYGHGPLGDVRFALGSGVYYVRLGLLSGPVMGALGALWRRRRVLFVLLGAASLLVLEPLAWLAYFHGAITASRGFVPVALSEAAFGVVVALFAVRRYRTSATL